MRRVAFYGKIEREDIIKLDKNLLEDCDVLDLKDVTYFHISFVGWLADKLRNKKIKIIYPEVDFLRGLIWI